MVTDQNRTAMPETQASFDSRRSEDERPLLPAHNDHPSTGGRIEPTATGESIIGRSFQAASDMFNKFRSRPDLTSVIQGMEKWGKAESGLAPIEEQVVCLICHYSGDQADWN
jgi:hypothetical protein